MFHTQVIGYICTSTRALGLSQAGARLTRSPASSYLGSLYGLTQRRRYTAYLVEPIVGISSHPAFRLKVRHRGTARAKRILLGEVLRVVLLL